MDSIGALGCWIANNESLLSGMAALIVLAGVILSPLGIGVRRLMKGDASGASDPAGADTAAPAPAPKPELEILTLQKLTAPSPHEIQFAKSDNVRIAFNVRGSGPHNLVAAPGIISHLNIGDQLPTIRDSLDGLARFARVVAFDKRGQGLSDPTLHSPDLEERARDIGAVMDAAGMERAFLMGVSEGGPMCMHFAHAHPERVQGLILFGTTARFVQSDDYPIGIPRHSIETLPKYWGKGVLRDLFFPSISREQMDDNTYKAMEHLIGSREAIDKVVQMMLETDVRPLLPEIQVPALVLHFAGDLAIPIRLGRFVAEQLPNASFMEVSGVDHADLSQSRAAMERVEAFCNATVASDRETHA
jgi:pimeloyl-ACP methyl ester carboxylesterase